MVRLPRSAFSVGLGVALLTSCAGDERKLTDPVFDLPAPPVTVAETAPGNLVTVQPTIAPVTDSIATHRLIEIEELFSPANATAEMSGVGAVPTDLVTVDGEPADVLSLDVDAQSQFVLQVWIDDEGPHTVCVADACGRVYTLAADADSPQEVIAKIEQAMPLAKRYLDYPAEFGDWEVSIGAALAGTGGTTDSDTMTVTIYRNRGRTIDDFVRTILHEFGHVADFERLDDAERGEYLELRGIGPSTAWRDEAAHRLDQWGYQPSEDFAEVMVAIWSNQRWQPRTDQLAPPPSADALARIAKLTAP